MCADEAHAEPCNVLQVLMYAQLRGNSQNVVKIAAGALTGPAGVAKDQMRVIQEGPLSVQLDGGKRLGMLAAEAAVAEALERCQQHGFGIAGTCNTSSSTGALGCGPPATFQCYPLQKCRSFKDALWQLLAD